MPLDLTQVDALAAEAHKGQTRRHGAPYIEHPRAVLRIVEDLAPVVGIVLTDEIRAAALLHDVIEDSAFDEAALTARFGPAVATRVAALTKTGKGEDATRAYYAKLAAADDDALRLVKAADRCHNLSELHFAADPQKLEKYLVETRTHVIPFARKIPGLVRALEDAMRAARVAQRSQPATSTTDASTSGAATGGARSGGAHGGGVSGGAHALPAGLYAIVEPSEDIDALVMRVRALCEAGVALVQLRSKGRDDREVLDVLALLLVECARYDISVIVNDRTDLCVAAGADGVHVGTTDLPAAVARRIVGRDAIVGTSTHSHKQAVHDVRASGALDAVDYLALGPIFESPTKKGHAPVVGVQELARVCAASKKPVAAIGGFVSPARVAEAAAVGAHLVCALSALALPPREAHAMARRMSLAFHAARR